MSVLPLNLIKGTRSVLYERLENTEDTEEVEHQIDKLKAKVCVREVNSDQLSLFNLSRRCPSGHGCEEGGREMSPMEIINGN